MQQSYKGQRFGTKSFSIHFAKIKIWDIETEEREKKTEREGGWGKEKKC